MKYIGLILVVLGVGLSAVLGSRMAPEMLEQARVSGRASLLAGAEKATFSKYCVARKDATLPVVDGCPKEKKAADVVADKDSGKKDDAAPKPVPPTPTYASLLAVDQQKLSEFWAKSHEATGVVEEARKTWLNAYEAKMDPVARAAVLTVPAPRTRISGWFSVSGFPFLGGLVLIVVGSVLARLAVKKEAKSEGTDSGDAVDFGQKLSALLEDATRMAQEMAANEAPTDADFDKVLKAVEFLQLDKFAPLIDARGRVQNKYGLAGFAAIFDPLSSGERRVNRTWSALVDRHWPEATASMALAATSLERAKKELDGFVSPG